MNYSRVIFFWAALFLSVWEASAQPATNADAPLQVVSPEVSADRKVTFRIYAPNAKTVTLNGDFFTHGPTSAPLTKGPEGVWTHTLEVKEPGVYG